MNAEEINQEITKIDARIEFLNADRTVWVSVWAGPPGYTPYNHGPYFRKLEKKRLRAKRARLVKRLSRLS